MDMTDPGSPIPDPEEYCRQLEAYLCRKNDGHLIRIVGPAFEQVCGWATRGIPLKMAQRGIDRYIERYYAKGPRRRPVRVEFCEPDVLDVFDEWRRALGIPGVGSRDSGFGGRERGFGNRESGFGAPAGGRDAGLPGARTDDDGADVPGPRGTLPAHLERVIARLTMIRGGADRSLDVTLNEVVRELDAMRAVSKTVRGDARGAMLQRLRDLDASLLAVLHEQCDAATRAQLDGEAEDELRPFRARMPPAAYQESQRACVDRLLRERARLPTIAYD